MPQFNSRALKILKIVHLFCASSWLGGACCMLLLNIASSDAISGQMLYGINMASHVIDLWIVVTCGVWGCLLTGLLYGLFSPFGFFKFKWVTLKWLITCICFLSGWIFLGAWEQELLKLSENMALLQGDHLYYILKTKHLGLSCCQIALLISLYVISVFKPWRKKGGN